MFEIEFWYQGMYTCSNITSPSTATPSLWFLNINT